MTCAISELEIDEGLEVGCDELIDDNYSDDHHQQHEGQGEVGKPEAIAAFEAVGEPVDNHSNDEDDEGGGIVLEYVGNMGPVPMAADAFHHLGGGEPGLLVGFGGVEVGAAAEEEAGEADEDKGEEGVPDQGEGVFERRGVVAFWEEGGDDVEHGDGNGDDQHGEMEHAEERAGIDGVGGTDEDVAKHYQDDAQQGRFVFP